MLTDPETGRFRADNVKVLTDEQATTRNIRSALYEIASKALADDLVVLYFSTHGSNPKGNTTKQGSGLFVTHDTELKNPQTLFATAFGMGELVRFVQDNLRAERTSLSSIAASAETPTEFSWTIRGEAGTRVWSWRASPVRRSPTSRALRRAGE